MDLVKLTRGSVIGWICLSGTISTTWYGWPGQSSSTSSGSYFLWVNYTHITRTNYKNGCQSVMNTLLPYSPQHRKFQLEGALGTPQAVITKRLITSFLPCFCCRLYQHSKHKISVVKAKKLRRFVFDLTCSILQRFKLTHLRCFYFCLFITSKQATIALQATWRRCWVSTRTLGGNSVGNISPLLLSR